MERLESQWSADVPRSRQAAAAAALGTSRGNVPDDRTHHCQCLYTPQSADTQLIIQINRAVLFIFWYLVGAEEALCRYEIGEPLPIERREKRISATF